MRNKSIKEVGEKLQEIKFKGNIQTLYTLMRKLTGSIQQKTLKNYIRVLHKDGYIIFNEGIWEAYIEEQPESDKKDIPIETKEELEEKIKEFKRAKPIKKTPKVEKKIHQDKTTELKIKKQKQRQELSRLVENLRYKKHNEKIDNAIVEMNKRKVTVIWEDKFTYYIICKNCYEMHTKNRFEEYNMNKLKAHLGILNQAIETKHCQFCGCEI